MRFEPKHWIKDTLGLAMYYPGQAIVAATPRSMWNPVARLGGDLARRMADDGAEMHAELLKLFGDERLPRPAEDLVREAYHSAMFNEIEVLRYASMRPETIDQVCTVEGRAHLDAALAEGNGAILLIGHFGANQMIMPALGHLGYPMNQLSAPPPVWAEILEDRSNPLWRAILNRRWALEQRLPVQHINVFRFLRRAFECLRENQVLGLAFDGGGGRGWTQVQLLARTANVSTQPVQLWRKTGARLLPAMVVRDPGDSKHHMVITEPMEWISHPTRVEEDRLNMQAYVDRFAAWVRARPDHYLQFMLMRRRVRSTDVQPLFDDYPSAPNQLDPDAAMARLRKAGEWSE
jgi:lauroyl/myristoyl acyltransferase